MKHFSKHLFTLTLFALSCLFYSCEQEQISSMQSDDNFTVRVKNGYLEFKDQKTFEEIKASLSEGDRTALDAWESQFSNFTSIRSIREQAIDSQENWYKKLENMNEKDREFLQAGNDFWYSDFIKNHSDLFILYDSGMYRMNVPFIVEEDIRFINNKRLLKIGDSLYHYGTNTIKIIQDGDESKLNLLPSISESSKELKIVVRKLTEKIIKSGDNLRTNYFYGNNTCNDTDGDEKVNGFVISGYELDYSNTYGNYIVYYVYVKAEAWIKGGLFGGFIEKRTSELEIEGDVFVGAAKVKYDINVHQLYTAVQVTSTFHQRMYYGWPANPQPEPIEGFLTFRGRANSQCSM